MSATKFEELQKAVYEYGDAAFQNLLRCKAVADAIIQEFPAYIGCTEDCVAAVPAEGAFDPRKDYGDEAFSFNQRDVIILEPVRFGLSLIVGNAEDAGSLFLRTVLSVEIVGDAYHVFVSGRPLVRVPIEFEGALGPVFDEIHNEFLETFTLEVMEFNDARFKDGIGFLPIE